MPRLADDRDVPSGLVYRVDVVLERAWERLVRAWRALRGFNPYGGG